MPVRVGVKSLDEREEGGVIGFFAVFSGIGV